MYVTVSDINVRTIEYCRVFFVTLLIIKLYKKYTITIDGNISNFFIKTKPRVAIPILYNIANIAFFRLLLSYLINFIIIKYVKIFIVLILAMLLIIFMLTIKSPF